MDTVTRIAFDGEEFVLTADQDLVDLMDRIETAARTRPSFVAFSADAGMTSVLVCRSTRVNVTVESPSELEPGDFVPVDLPSDWDC